MSRRKAAAAEQPTLPGTSSRYRPGTIEKHAAREMTDARSAGVLSESTRSLQAAYTTLARELDRAEREGDRYGKIYTVREMLKVRQALTPSLVGDGEEGPQTVEEFVAGLPAAPVGDPPAGPAA